MYLGTYAIKTRTIYNNAEIGMQLKRIFKLATHVINIHCAKHKSISVKPPLYIAL